MKPYIPVYTRPPNKFIRYETRYFDDGFGHTANVTKNYISRPSPIQQRSSFSYSRKI